MQLTDFTFKLPDQLIARYPLEERTASRLLSLDGNNGTIEHGNFTDIEQLLNLGDLLIFNDTRVIPARLNARKESGGKIEVLIERLISETEALAHIRSSKSPKPDSKIILEDNSVLTVIGRKDNLFIIKAEPATDLLTILDAIGHIPLPPYIDRPDEQSDHERYQTVYSKHKGAVAAPTAGLHFSKEIIKTLKAKGVETGFVTLHVGAGTFQPVRVDNISEHKMHSEWFQVSAELVEQIKQTKERGGRVVAVGTTSVRCLESAASSGELKAFSGDTDIFITPGYEFKMVDVLITNFHLPESTLIMLVSAFAGRENILRAYHQAIEEKYRFFSYGDAMFLKKGLTKRNQE
ncbi:MAG: tRNA preQ1(34) S-adenosylmethionine ribosyltransferase-isomerase QueA [Gammaproteobacteria bacterium]|nr:MAG: tRNA preQ1(34) S-adenosylmethionine ribosyltransferase-isomerase QueA [Gammaproteobacteria bacterium]